MTSLPVECGPGGPGYTSLINSSVLSAMTHIWHPYVQLYYSVCLPPTQTRGAPVTRASVTLFYLNTFMTCRFFFLESISTSNLSGRANFLGCHSWAKYLHAHTHCPRKVHCSTCWLMGFSHGDGGMRRWRVASGVEEESCPWPCSAASSEGLTEQAKCVSALHATTNCGKVSSGRPHGGKPTHRKERSDGGQVRLQTRFLCTFFRLCWFTNTVQRK